MFKQGVQEVLIKKIVSIYHMQSEIPRTRICKLGDDIGEAVISSNFYIDCMRDIESKRWKEETCQSNTDWRLLFPEIELTGW